MIEKELNKNIVKEKENICELNSSEYVSFKKANLNNIHYISLILIIALNVVYWWEENPISLIIQNNTNASLFTGIVFGVLAMLYVITGAYKD